MSPMLVLRAGQVFDGERSRGETGVLIQDGKISDLATSGASPPEGAEVVDFGSDACLLPGLIDAHVHLAFDASADVVTSLAACDDGALLYHMAVAAARALRAGVTTVRDLGDRDYLSLELSKRRPPAALPHIVAAGPPITTSGGHCYFLGGEAQGEAALRAAVRERAARGCDVVKVMVSGGNLTPGSRPHESQYDLAALRVMVDEAHRAGLPAAAHVHAARAVADAVEAGFDTLEHATFFTADGVGADPALLDRIAASGVVVSVTVGSVPDGSPPHPAIARRMAAIVANHGRMFRAGASATGLAAAGPGGAKSRSECPRSQPGDCTAIPGPGKGREGRDHSENPDEDGRHLPVAGGEDDGDRPGRYRDGAAAQEAISVIHVQETTTTAPVVRVRSTVPGQLTRTGAQDLQAR